MMLAMALLLLRPMNSVLRGVHVLGFLDLLLNFSTKFDFLRV